MRLIVLLLTTLCYEAPSFTCAKVEVPKNIRATSKRLSKLTKRQDDLGYLEQCSILQFWDKQIGRVNVLAFFDSTWPFSHRQAAMLKVLRERFDKTGFENIQFLAINAAAGESEYVSRAEIEVEEETWKQISPSEAEGVPPIITSADALAAALGPDVYFIQDSAELQIWPKLRAFRDQILVIDRCGRLTYQVIVPWSILHFPYVKAAILSTYKDEPCGNCEPPFDYSSEAASDPPNEASTPSNPIDEKDAARALSQGVEESTTTDVFTQAVEVGNDTSSAGFRSELLFSPSDDYDGQAVADDSSRVSGPIDANDPTDPSLLENATSIATTLPVAQPTAQPAKQTDSIHGDFEEYSTEASQTTDNQDVTRLPDDGSAFTDEPISGTIVNDTVVDDYESTTYYSLDEDYSNVTETHYEDADDSNFTASTIDHEAIGGADNLEAEELTINVGDVLDPATAAPTNSTLDSSGERTRLTEPKEIESLDARDVLKSRSTNARSVSPNDGSDNRLQMIQVKSETTSRADTAKGQAGQLEADYLIPIRIIMRAPHVDEYSDRSLKAHEYLVLKTGQPSYHEHLDSGHGHGHGHEHDQRPHEAVRKKSEAVKSTFARDESPGLYGELADYWQNYGNEHAHDDNADTGSISLEDADHEHVLEQEQSFAEGSVTFKPSTSLNDHSKAVESDNEQHYDDHSTSYEDADIIDEEAKSKLIAHYSKLLPWLYYVLAK